MKLQGNQINGSIPDEFCVLGELQTVNLSRNSLSGAIPSGISNLTKLRVLNLECNQLYGSIPRTISNLEFLMELQLGNNSLSGDIPRMPQRLSTALNLSSNRFSGPIPKTLNLPQLEILDLSHNEFTGEVPGFFYGMSSLSHLILSYNQLSGVLPNFRPWLILDIAGNRGLVNGAIIPSTPSGRGISAAITIGIFVVPALVGFGFAAVIFISVCTGPVAVSETRQRLR